MCYSCSYYCSRMIKEKVLETEKLLMLINEECGNLKSLMVENLKLRYNHIKFMYVFHANVQCRLRLSGKS